MCGSKKPYPNQPYLLAMLRVLLAWIVFASARKTEPSKARSLLQAWQKLEADRAPWNISMVKGFQASAFEPPPPYNYSAYCQASRVVLERSRIAAPVEDLTELRRKFQEDVGRAQLQMTTADLDDNRTLTILDSLLELREKELSRVQDDQPQFSLFNPSVVPLPDSWRHHASEQWLAALRHQEFSELHSYGCTPRCVSSTIVIAVLDSKLRLTRPVRVIHHKDVFAKDYECWQEHHECNFGPEDPRLLWDPDKQKMLFFFNSKIRTGSPLQSCPRIMVRMHAGEVADDLTVSRAYQIAMDSEVHGHKPRIGNRSMGPIEKNWSPFLYAGAAASNQVLLEQSVDPHIVLDFDTDSGVAAGSVWNTSGSLVHQLMSSKNFSHAHGGVGPILITSTVVGLDLEPPFYLSMLHLEGKPFLYHSYFFAFAARPPFQILRVGHAEVPLRRELSVYTTIVAFPVHMQLVAGADAPQRAEADQLMIFYGAGDCDPRFLQLPLSRLNTYL